MGFNPRFVSLFLFVFIVLSRPIPQATSHSSNVSQVPQEATSHSSNVSQVPQEATSHSSNVSQVPQEATSHSSNVSQDPQQATSHSSNVSQVPQEATSHSSNVSQVPQEATSHSSNVSQVPQATSSSNVSQAFEDWMKKYGRVYSSEGEKQKRFAIFQKTFKFVDDFQKDGVKKLYSVGLNDFADRTPEELSFQACLSEVELDISTTERNSSSETDAPDFTNEEYGFCEYGIVDWSNSVSPVRTQGHCGSCWAMGTVAAVEAANRIRWQIAIPPLSVQQVLDCTPKGNYHCRGGDVYEAYEYLKSIRGLIDEDSYPYTAQDGTRDYEKLKPGVFADIDDFTRVSPPTEDNLHRALCYQPVTANMAADVDGIYNFVGGIYHAECGQGLHHTVLVVGVGRDDDGTEFWRILNSWGPNWGEKLRIYATDKK